MFLACLVRFEEFIVGQYQCIDDIGHVVSLDYLATMQRCMIFFVKSFALVVTHYGLDLWHMGMLQWSITINPQLL